MKRKKAKKKYNWKYQAGGTNLTSSSKYCCDDSYRNVKTGAVAVVISTIDAHFSMPSQVECPARLKRRAGVKRVSVFMPYD